MISKKSQTDWTKKMNTYMKGRISTASGMLIYVAIFLRANHLHVALAEYLFILNLEVIRLGMGLVCLPAHL